MRRPTQNLGNCIKDLKTVTCSIMKDDRLNYWLALFGQPEEGNATDVRTHEFVFR